MEFDRIKRLFRGPFLIESTHPDVVRLDLCSISVPELACALDATTVDKYLGHVIPKSREM